MLIDPKEVEVLYDSLVCTPEEIAGWYRNEVSALWIECILTEMFERDLAKFKAKGGEVS